MNVGDALRADILANPADNDLRLLYADWLEDNNNADYARYIRWSLANRHTHPVPRVHWRKWFNPWWTGKTYAHHCGPMMLLVAKTSKDKESRHHLYARRGFVESIFLPYQDFLMKGKEYCSQHPVERVCLTDKRPLRFAEDIYLWEWHQLTEPNYSWRLPKSLFDLLLPDLNCTAVRDYTNYAARHYNSDQSAQKGLELACSRWVQRYVRQPLSLVVGGGGEG